MGARGALERVESDTVATAFGPRAVIERTPLRTLRVTDAPQVVRRISPAQRGSKNVSNSVSNFGERRHLTANRCE